MEVMFMKKFILCSIVLLSAVGAKNLWALAEKGAFNLAVDANGLRAVQVDSYLMHGVIALWDILITGSLPDLMFEYDFAVAPYPAADMLILIEQVGMVKDALELLQARLEDELEPVPEDGDDLMPVIQVDLQQILNAIMALNQIEVILAEVSNGNVDRLEEIDEETLAVNAALMNIDAQLPGMPAAVAVPDAVAGPDVD
jgi:hypothetical protein